MRRAERPISPHQQALVCKCKAASDQHCVTHRCRLQSSPVGTLTGDPLPPPRFLYLCPSVVGLC